MSLADLQQALAAASGSGDEQALFAACAGSARIPITITDPRRDDNPIVYANDAFLRLTGYERHEVYGHNCRFMQGPGTDPADVARLRAGLARHQEVGVEILNYRKDGTPFWNGLYIGPVIDEAGELLYYFASQLDVTDQRESEKVRRGEKYRIKRSIVALTRELERATAELRSREEWLWVTLEAAPEAILVIDHEGTLASLNPAAERVFGCSAAQLVGQDVSALVLPLAGEQREPGRPPPSWSTGVFPAGSGRLLRGRRGDGDCFPLELVVGEVPSDGRAHFVGFIRDLTARERAEGELRQAQKMEAVGQLTGGIAHDFNNLLTIIMGNLEMLEERVDGEAERPLLAEALHAVRTGAELTERLLAFARRQALHARPLDVRRQLDEAAFLLRPALGETIRVRTEAALDLPPVLADQSQLQNAILNLAINARDAMPKGGQLVIEARLQEFDPDLAATLGNGLQPGGYVVLSVTDTGSGMAPEVRERAFEPFFTTKSGGTASGLGLSMVWGFAKQSGGYARIYSEPGRGTTVRLFLPQAGEAAPAAGAKGDVRARAFPGRGETVLVVEDDPGVRRYAVARLNALGYRVLEAEHGPAALEILTADDAVELLFTDVIMPGGMTGHDLMEAALRLRPDLRVVFTSGYAEPELLQRSRAEGAILMRKPYTALDLARTVRHTLDGVAEVPPA